MAASSAGIPNANWRRGTPSGQTACHVAKKANRQNPTDRFYEDFRPLVVRLVNETSSQQPAMVATRDYIPSALFRDITIRKYSHLSDREICAKLDSEIPQGDSPSIGLPAHWMEKFKIKTFSQAYEDLRCRNLVQKMISKAKNRCIYLPLKQTALPS
jgi:hypothetical protein